MSDALPEFVLVRHGETAWSLSGQHTGRSDIPLTPKGEDAARVLGSRLAGDTFARIWSSPSQRASRTCALAGFAAQCETKADLAEWDYGDYEGVTTKRIVAATPDWNVFRDGCPGGETVSDIGARADRIIAELKQVDGNVLIFSSGHILRVLAARWIGLPVENGARFTLDTASVSILGYEHGRDEPVIRLWNRRHDT